MRTLLAVLFVIPGVLAAQADSTWRDHNAATRVARQAGDWVSFIHHIDVLVRELHGYPPSLLALARGQAHLGDTAVTFRTLRQYAAMGIARDLEADNDLAPLRGTPSWRDLTARMAANQRVMGTFDIAFVVPDSDRVPEDIAYDARRRRFLLSSIRHGGIVAITPAGDTGTFAAGTPGWAMMALGIDARRGVLWATAIPVPQAVGYNAADSARSAVLRYDLASGRLLRRFDLPVSGERRSPADMTVADNGDVYIPDSRTGAIYVVRAQRDAARESLEVLVPPGEFASPQTPALSGDGRRLFVADYLRGIGVVDLATRRISWLAKPDTVTDHGIDGLVRVGTDLIGVQNGVLPNRVIRFVLDPAMTRIERTVVLAQDTSVIREPTHAVVVGNDLYVIAESGWRVLTDAGGIEPGQRLVPARIIRIQLR